MLVFLKFLTRFFLFFMIEHKRKENHASEMLKSEAEVIMHLKNIFLNLATSRFILIFVRLESNHADSKSLEGWFWKNCKFCKVLTVNALGYVNWSVRLCLPSTTISNKLTCWLMKLHSSSYCIQMFAKRIWPPLSSKTVTFCKIRSLNATTSLMFPLVGFDSKLPLFENRATGQTYFSSSQVFFYSIEIRIKFL